MEARVSQLTSSRLLRAAAIGALLSWATSAAADPTKDECIAANESAQDLRQAGKLREAREKLTVCLAASCPRLLRSDCAQRVSELDAATPTVVFEAKDGAGNDLSAVRVTVDGQPFAQRLDGRPLPANPGEHRFEFEADGRSKTEKTLVLREGEKNRREPVALGKLHAEAVSVAPARASEAPPNHQVSTEGAPSHGSVERGAGIAVGGAGVVGLLVGSVLGLVSKSTYDHALSSECGTAVGFADPKTCTRAGYNDVQSAHGQATAATVGFVAGAALLGGGAYLYFAAPKGDDVTVGATAGAGSVGLTVHGRW
jgi:hypothetical protein